LSENSPAAKEFLHKYLDIILTVIKGSSLVAQDSASGALKKLCKTESDLIVELYPKLLEVFKAILQENSYRRIFIYDTLAEFVETIQDETFMKQVLNEVMPILIESFGGAKINDGAFIPQFECINSLIRVSGDNIFPFAEKLLSQVVTIAREISSVLKVSSPKQKSKDRILLEYELNNNLMRCFDFIGTLAMSIPDKFTGLSCAAIIPQLIFAYLDTDNLLLKQLVYSVLGDLMPIMDSHVFEGDIDRAITALIDDTKILPASMDPGKTYLSIATNALYALNEVLLKFPQRVDPEKVLARLLKIYENSKVEWDDQLHKFLTLNCALVYGNLGHQNPAVAARHLKECLKKVCYGFILSKSDDDKTKNDAFIGLNRIILCNPADFLLNVAFYLEAIGLYQQPSPEVAQGITHILEELLKGDESVKKQLSEAYLGLSGPAKSGLKAQFNFPPN
jgi:hypothetical protein